MRRALALARMRAIAPSQLGVPLPANQMQAPPHLPVRRNPLPSKKTSASPLYKTMALCRPLFRFTVRGGDLVNSIQHLTSSAVTQPLAPPSVPVTQLDSIAETREGSGRQEGMSTCFPVPRSHLLIDISFSDHTIPTGAAPNNAGHGSRVPREQEDEVIDIPDFNSSSSDSSSPAASPRQRSPARAPVTQVPRAGPHSQNRPTRQSTPATSKPKSAHDVWTFFQESGKRQACRFCL